MVPVIYLTVLQSLRLETIPYGVSTVLRKAAIRRDKQV